MGDTTLHPIAAEVLDALTVDETAQAAVFVPPLGGLPERLLALEPSALGEAVFDLTGIFLKLIEVPSLRGAADLLAAQLNQVELVAAYQTYLTGVLREERGAIVASADAFDRFRGGGSPSSTVRSEPRDELLLRAPVRG
jgi:hypothetical protein